MRISDWSSDVCSSDLAENAIIGPAMQALRRANRQHRIEQAADLLVGIDIGRSALSCREDVRWRNLVARFGARQMPGKGADDRQASRPGWRTCLAGGPIEGKPGGDDRRALLLHVADEAREQIGRANV